MRVFMCTVGTCGLSGWAISEIPEAQKFGRLLSVNFVFKTLEAGADLVAQALEPLAGPGFFLFNVVGQTDGQIRALHRRSSR